MADQPRRPARKTASRKAAESPSRIPKERAKFKQLLSANPNYFGNAPETGLPPVQEISGNTNYEELSCVGYSLDLRQLEATVEVKLPFGYSGLLCSPGSTEYVRFYVDYGAGWQDVGVAAFNSHDLPNDRDCAGDPNKPLTYVLALEIDPQSDWCRRPVLPAVRAILSWNLMPPPGNPSWVPIWGNTLDDHIQIKPRPWWYGDLFASLGDIVEKIDLPPLYEEAFPAPIPIPDPPPLQLTELAQLYGGDTKPRTKAGEPAAVESHRFAALDVHAAIEAGDIDQASLASKISELKALGLDWGAIVTAFEDTTANVSYEEVECLGLDYDLERLAATFRVKLPYGYSGDLCTAGSTEYVAFWADWEDTCEWTYLGTVPVNVHDIATIPAGGLSYSAVLPVDLNRIRRRCQEPRISRVRAVLSWAIPPSTVDPDALTTWGNRIDAHVQVRPGDPIVEIEPIISIIGGIGLVNIDVFVDGLTRPNVPFAMHGAARADEWAPHTRKCPFGGTIIVQGPTFPGYKYRLEAHNLGTGATEFVKSPFFTTDWLGVGTWRTPDPTTGFSWYLNHLANINNVLSNWRPTGDDLWEIRLELANAFGMVLGSTPWYMVQTDNTGPVRKPLNEPPTSGDTMDIHIDTGGGDCADFDIGTTVGGRFVARDPNFGAFSIGVLPSSLSPPPPIPSAGLIQTPSALPLPGGSGWTLNTSGMQACGYVVVLNVSDRSIVNSNPGSHNHNFTDVGFCLREP